jgi:hypothetical protein
MGGLDLIKYCQVLGYATAEPDAETIDDWNCVRSASITINMQRLCSENQAGSIAVYGPSSGQWSCEDKQHNILAGIDLSAYCTSQGYDEPDQSDNGRVRYCRRSPDLKIDMTKACLWNYPNNTMLTLIALNKENRSDQWQCYTFFFS